MNYFREKMRIGFRADASVQHGAGHIMRCLTLADELQRAGNHIFFISRELQGNLFDLIEKRGFKLYRLPYEENEGSMVRGGSEIPLNLQHNLSYEIDAQETIDVLVKNNLKLDWLIVDGYVFDQDWERRIRPLVIKIMVIDDMANRYHDCDLLLDQNFHDNYQTRYAALVPPHCKKVLGPQYALLRKEFRQYRTSRTIIEHPVRKIFIFFSGSDPENETQKALSAIELLNDRNIEIDVVVGSANINKDIIRNRCECIDNIKFYCQVDNMAILMANSDFAIGAAGSSSWERCCLGLPAMVTVLSEDQRGIATALGKYGAVINMGWYADLTVEDYVHAIEKVRIDQLKEMAVKGMQIVDGLGTARVAEELLN